MDATNHFRRLWMWADCFVASDEETVAALATGATANSVCFHLIEHSHCNDQHPELSTYLSSARLSFGDGPLGEVRRAADIPAGLAGKRGKFTALAPNSDIPALLRDGAAEAPGGQLDSQRDLSVLREQGGANPLRVNMTGHYSLGVVDFGESASRKARGPVVSASYFERTFAKKRPNSSDGGVHLPYVGDGL